MRRFSIALLALLCLTAFCKVAVAQESYYIRKNGSEYRQAAAQASALTNNAQVLQSQLNSQRAAFNQGMTSTNQRVRSRAKQNFLNYMDRLQKAFLQAQNAHGPAIYWGEKYAAGLLQLQSRAAQGRGVVAQVRALRNAQTSLRNTRDAIMREARAAYKRR
ncbi:MAG: hypothetical protein K9L19_13505 [Desulfarculaceae bacterium]|nr:hypothetical protein [Desulfarculaceae bacterium]